MEAEFIHKKVGDKETAQMLEYVITQMETSAFLGVMRNKYCMENNILYFANYAPLFEKLAEAYVDSTFFLEGHETLDRLHAAVLLNPDVEVKAETAYPLGNHLEYMANQDEWELEINSDYLFINKPPQRFEVAQLSLEVVKKLTRAFDEEGGQPESLSKELMGYFFEE